MSSRYDRDVDYSQVNSQVGLHVGRFSGNITLLLGILGEGGGQIFFRNIQAGFQKISHYCWILDERGGGGGVRKDHSYTRMRGDFHEKLQVTRA